MIDPAAEIIKRIDGRSDVCQSDPPRTLYDGEGQEWGAPGDCWCTKTTAHAGDCACEICTARYGMPGWPKPVD